MSTVHERIQEGEQRYLAGDFLGAAQIYRDALRVAREQRAPLVAEVDCLVRLALSYHQLNVLPEAIRLYDEALAQPLRPAARAHILQNKSAVLAANHDYEEAATIGREARSIAERLGDERFLALLLENQKTLDDLAREQPSSVVIVSPVHGIRGMQFTHPPDTIL